MYKVFSPYSRPKTRCRKILQMKLLRQDNASAKVFPLCSYTTFHLAFGDYLLRTSGLSSLRLRICGALDPMQTRSRKVTWQTASLIVSVRGLRSLAGRLLRVPRQLPLLECRTYKNHSMQLRQFGPLFIAEWTDLARSLQIVYPHQKRYSIYRTTLRKTHQRRQRKSCRHQTFP